MIIVGTVAAKTVWSICDENAHPGCAADAESQGYWNFAYDDAAPYATAGLMCCWWERWYKWSHYPKTTESSANTLNLGSSDGVSTSGATSSSGSSGSTSSAQVETKSFCPSCCSMCDDEDTGAMQARSDAMMAKKPWLTEGKNTKQPTVAPTVTATPTVAQMVMTFSEAK